MTCQLVITTPPVRIMNPLPSESCGPPNPSWEVTPRTVSPGPS